jgi:zinc transporter ZupT
VLPKVFTDFFGCLFVSDASLCCLSEMSMSEFPRMVGMAGLSALVSGLLPLLCFRNGVKKSTLHLLLGISAGILFAIATVDLIPEGIAVSSADNYAKKQQEYADKEGLRLEHKHEELGRHEHEIADYGRIVTMVGVGCGFFALVLLEQFLLAAGVAHSHQTASSSGGAGDDMLIEVPEQHAKHAHKHANGLSESFSLTAFAAIAVHSFVDGIVIGGSFRVSTTIGARVAVAIVLHKVPDGFVVASLLTATNRYACLCSDAECLYLVFSLFLLSLSFSSVSFSMSFIRYLFSSLFSISSLFLFVCSPFLPLLLLLLLLLSCQVIARLSGSSLSAASPPSAQSSAFFFFPEFPTFSSAECSALLPGEKQKQNRKKIVFSFCLF